MARKKISEFRAKKLLCQGLGIEYKGISFSSDSLSQIENLDSLKEYVVKVDQGVKKRGQQGLIKVKIRKEDIQNTIKELREKGFQHFLVEEFVHHGANEEKYLAIERVRDGYQVHYSHKGGVGIEENKESVKRILLRNRNEIDQVVDDLGLKQGSILTSIIDVFDTNYFSFLELNPFISLDSYLAILDAAVEVDSAAEFFVDGRWSNKDFREYSERKKTPEEKAVEALADKSQASFSLTVLNPNGSLFMLLSGGGASIVLADEAYSQGKGEEVANYGEYSGNPNEEETYVYTKEIIRLLLKSNAQKKVLLVAGGVANFTDVRITFRGVIKALSEESGKLQKQNVKLFVRRGGPNQEEGLLLMKEFLQNEKLLGSVHGPDSVLTIVVKEALHYIKT